MHSGLKRGFHITEEGHAGVLAGPHQPSERSVQALGRARNLAKRRTAVASSRPLLLIPVNARGLVHLIPETFVQLLKTIPEMLIWIGGRVRGLRCGATGKHC